MPFNAGSQFWLNLAVDDFYGNILGTTAANVADLLNQSGSFYGVSAIKTAGVANVSLNITGYLNDYFDDDSQVKQAALAVIPSVVSVSYFAVQDSVSGQKSTGVDTSGIVGSIERAFGITPGGGGSGMTPTTLLLIGGALLLIVMISKR